MVYQEQNDETLVMLTLAGEQRAYEVLVARYENVVIAAAASVLHSRYMAEDAAQDAFITAWMKLNVLCEPAKYSAWVCRIAKNCAKNILMRMRGYLSLDTDCDTLAGESSDPELLLLASEERAELHGYISTLSKKVQQIIYMHYFEELSVSQIAEKLCIAEGTVKAQLHNGRKQIRKGLGAMNENANDALVRKVMKKVEELKAWQFQNSKNGFETEYKDVLAEVETLPESADKYHALADVLMRGWWWIPGEKNDALFDRIREAAELGKNDDVMVFVVAREDEKWSGQMRIEFIRDKQIPRLEAGGFTKALAREWFWLGVALLQQKEPDTENGFAAFEKVLSLLTPADFRYAHAKAAIEMHRAYIDRYRTKNIERYMLRACAEEYRVRDGELRRWDLAYLYIGGLWAEDRQADFVFRNASYCDGRFTVDGLAVGETFTGSDGTTLTFISNSAVVETPCGTFEGCVVWETVHERAAYRTFYKHGIGIVRQERRFGGFSDVRLLKNYNILGGDGQLPMAAGNTWEYTSEHDPQYVLHASKFTVCYADGKSVTLSYTWNVERLQYNENSWLDMIQQIRNEYCMETDGAYRICDVYAPIARAEALATTEVEKAHTKAACSVARRILATDPAFHPAHTARGLWDFFVRTNIACEDGRITCDHDGRWSFEWKHVSGSDVASYPLLYNDIYGILQNATGCIWSDEWIAGTTHKIEYMLWDRYHVKTAIECAAVDEVTTAAGTFTDCMQLSLDVDGMTEGLEYRGGKMEYVFARGVGIVRMVTHYWKGACTATYELVEYTGTGEGYMPVCGGLTRRYEAIGLTDGYKGASEYTFVADADGAVYCMEDRAGIREIPTPITQYSAVLGEERESALWEAGERDEAWKQNSLNNFNLLLYFLAKPGRNTRRANRSIEINGFNMRMMEQFGDGAVPPAWHALYAWTALVRAAAFYGAERADEGYEHLEIAYTYYAKWNTYADGERLELGKKELLGDCVLLKNRGCVEFADGSRYPVGFEYRFNSAVSGRTLYVAMTALRGWEWFNKARKEERFQELVLRAKVLKDQVEEK